MKTLDALFRRLVWVTLLITALALVVASMVFAQGTTPPPAANPLTDADLLVVGVIAWAAGWIFSYAINTFSALGALYNKVPSAWKAPVLAGLYILVAVALGLLTCNSIYSSAVACPASPTDYVRLVFLALVAWASSQTAHATGGKDLAAIARYKAAASAPPAPPVVNG